MKDLGRGVVLVACDYESERRAKIMVFHKKNIISVAIFAYKLRSTNESQHLNFSYVQDNNKVASFLGFEDPQKHILERFGGLESTAHLSSFNTFFPPPKWQKPSHFPSPSFWRTRVVSRLPMAGL